MERRDFVRWTGWGIMALLLPGCGTKNLLQDQKAEDNPIPPPAPVALAYDPKQLVVASGTDPDNLLDRGFNALGGMALLVKKDSLVVIKPNFSVPRAPEVAATTKPALVGALVKKCLAAGAREVRVIDHPFTNSRMCLQNTGMKEAVEGAGGKILTLDQANDTYYRKVNINGEILKTALYSKDALEADVLINFPVLKHHSTTKITMGLKNMMGLVWDRGVFHSTDLLQSIADLASFRKPHLTILDATRGITDNGPSGPGTIREWNQLVLGTDPVAVDAYGAELFGLNPAKLGYLTAAARSGLGEMDISKLTVVKI